MKNNIKKLVKTIIMILLIMLILYNFMNINNAEQYIDIFGHKIMVVDEYQEQKDIESNDIIIGKKNSEGYEIGDLIIIRISGAIYFHRVIEIKPGNEYVTKGDGNYKPDAGTIKIEQIEGKVTNQIKNMGLILKMAESRIFTILILIITILALFYNNHIHKKRIKRRFKYTKKDK